MYLNIWSNIREFFVGLFSKVSFASIMLLFTGIIIGFIICGLTYLIIILRDIKKADQQVQIEMTTEDNEKNNHVHKLIRGAKDQFLEEGSTLTMNQKLDIMKGICLDLMKDIAQIYYPDSKYPMYELSIDEILRLNFYITERIEDVFAGRVLKLAKNFRIAQLFRMLDAKKKIEDNKIIKTSKKLHIGGITKWAFSALNLVNPVYWIKKFMLDVSLNIGVNKIANIIIDIVGQETAKVYSKNVFKTDDKEIEKEIKSLEEEIQEENV